MKQEEFIFDVQFPTIMESFRLFASTEILEMTDEIVNQLSTVSFTTPICNLTFQLDWSAWKEWRLALVENVKKIKQGKNHDVSKNISVKTKVVILTTEEKELAQWRAGRHLEIFLSYCFLASNLSFPGALDMQHTQFNSEYLIPIGDGGKPLTLPSTIELDYGTFLFTNANNVAKKLGWPIIKKIDLKPTLDWLAAMEIMNKPEADLRLQKALFSLLHASEVTGPNNIIWLAYALEAMFDTPALEIKKMLFNRIYLLLDGPEEQKKSLSKQFTKFYDLRSDFVHGRLRTIHPSYQKFLDTDALRTINEWEELTGFASAILISAIQKHIENKWKEVTFKEIYEHVSLSSEEATTHP